jgi:hypothetical protein
VKINKSEISWQFFAKLFNENEPIDTIVVINSKELKEG